MKWSHQNIWRIKDPLVRSRIEQELDRSGRLAPVTGSEKYWRAIIESDKINYRRSPELYRIGKGQQGVLTSEPYKSELLPHWCFATEEKALVSADSIYQLFMHYLNSEDFPGADMAKKFLHMGFTRARRYANHAGGQKYSQEGIIVQLPDALENEKARSAKIFKIFWDEARNDKAYKMLKAEFIKRYY